MRQLENEILKAENMMIGLRMLDCVFGHELKGMRK